MQVKYVGENDPRVLITGKIYPVMAVRYGWYLIKNEGGKALMYPPTSFVVMDMLSMRQEKKM